MDREALGRRIKEARKALRLTQDELSERIGITVYYLGEIERGEKTPSLEVLISLAEVLGGSCDHLLRDTISAGTVHFDAEISRKLSALTHEQRRVADAILDAYIKACK